MTEAVQAQPGSYWSLPEGERDAFRRTLRDYWQWPANRVPTEKQMIAMMQTYNRTWSQPIFLGGGMYGGKSSFICSLAISYCRIVPRSRFLLCRKEFSAFSASTLQELEEQIASCDDARHWEGKHEVEFENGSEIWYMGVGTPKQRQKLGSTQFDAAAIDEAPELEEPIFRMLQTRIRKREGSKAKRHLLVLTGNPYPGWIKEAFVINRKKGYTFIPALAADNPYRDPLWIDNMRSEMPDEWYRAYVLGDWNALVPDTVAIPGQLVEAAQKRRAQIDLSFVVWGIDLGHLGRDWTWIAYRAGDAFGFIDGWQQKRIDESAAEIVRCLSISHIRPHRMVFDYDGIGAGVADILLGMQEAGTFPRDIEIIGLHAERKASIRDPYGFANIQYANAKAQNAFALRRLLEGERGSLPHDDELAQDLSAANYSVLNGEIFIEPKSLVKKRLGRSPDKGDAIMLTMWQESHDEIAGLPKNADQMARRSQQEGAIVDRYGRPVSVEDALILAEQERAREAWLREPFLRLGVRSSHGVTRDPDLGY